MRTNRIANLSVAAVVLSVLAATGCGSASAPATTTKEITSQRAGDLTLSLQSESGELAQGQNRFVVAFRSAGDNQPVDAGKVTIGASMAMPGMAPMVAEMELKPSGTPGAYAATGDFKMSGAYMFEVRWDGPAGKGSSSFTTSVR